MMFQRDLVPPSPLSPSPPYLPYSSTLAFPKPTLLLGGERKRVLIGRPGGAVEGRVFEEGWVQGWKPAELTSYNPFTPFFLLSYPSAPPSPLPVIALFYPYLSSFFVSSPSAVTYTSTSPSSQTTVSQGPARSRPPRLLFSLLRLLFSHHLFPLLARCRGISKRPKVEKFGEQGYQVVYFSVVGAWGTVCHPLLISFDTLAFWAAYPCTHLPALLKAYYLTQIAYWLQQAPVLALGSRRGGATTGSSWCTLSKMLNYLRLERAKVVSFAVFVVGWKNYIFDPFAGLYMRNEMFGALCVLQAVKLFWFWLILRILYRTIMVSETDNNRCDAEEEVEECDEKEREKEALGSAEGVGLGLGASLAKDKSKDCATALAQTQRSCIKGENG
ncbi:hypothetical protein K438DRAFT_1967373 [Mycena galopus ATCC 62051]|nr:hypothetical protein K438DRAFT_1967373 [Mycena galopus ATCC 62051]